MHNAQLTNITSALLQKLLVALAIGAFALAVVATGSAHADAKQGTGGTQGCQIENDGKVETVPVGSKVGLFTCGQDGEWHFGWLINAIKAPSRTLAPSGLDARSTTACCRSQAPALRAERRSADAPDSRPAPPAPRHTATGRAGRRDAGAATCGDRRSA